MTSDWDKPPEGIRPPNIYEEPPKGTPPRSIYEVEPAEAPAVPPKEEPPTAPPRLKSIPGKKKPRIRVAAGAPSDLARLVIEHCFKRDQRQTVVVFSDDFYVYRDGRYARREASQIRTTINNFIDRRVDLDDGKGGTVPMTQWHVNETLAALRAQVMLEQETQPPCWLGAQGPPWGQAKVITVKNGVLDFATGKLHPNDPRWFALDGLNVIYEPRANCPLFEVALAQWLPDDEQARDCLQEVYGYLVSGANNLEKIVVIVGGPRSGKGTNGRILGELFGTSLVRPLLSSFVGDFGAASLTTASVAMFTDARLGKRADSAAAIEKMLAVSGRDSPGVARKYKEDFAGIIRARIVMLCNELPRLPDASAAMGNRFVLLRFLQSFLGSEDPELADKLIGELPGVFNWAVAGLKRLRSRGRFSMPDDSFDILQEYIDANTPLIDFLLDFGRFGKDLTIGKKELYENGYLRWCKNNDIKRPLTETKFFQALQPTRNVNTSCRCDPATGLTRKTDGARPPRHVHGLCLK